MGELVSRDEAKMAIEKLHDELVRERAYEESQGAADAMHVVLRLPAVEAVPVVHGHWKDNGNGTVSCSRCQTWFQKEREPYLLYCGYCGARMDME